MQSSGLTLFVLGFCGCLNGLPPRPKRNYDSENYDMTKLIEMGAHGISLNFMGKARIFPSFWNHIFRIELPHLNSLKWKPKKVMCRTQETLYNTNQAKLTDDNKDKHLRMRQLFYSKVTVFTYMVDYCEDLNFNLHEISKAVNRIYSVLESKVAGSVFNRSKRALLPFAGPIFRDLFGLALEKDNVKLRKKYDALEYLLGVHHNETLIVEKQLMGISRLFDVRTKRVNKEWNY